MITTKRITKPKFKTRTKKECNTEISNSFDELLDRRGNKKIYHIVLNEPIHPIPTLSDKKSMKKQQRDLYKRMLSLMKTFVGNHSSFLFVLELTEAYRKGKPLPSKEKREYIDYHFHILLTTNYEEEELKLNILNDIDLSTTLCNYDNRWFKDVSKRSNEYLKTYFCKEDMHMNQFSFNYIIN
jgi:hypothetical protein